MLAGARADCRRFHWRGVTPYKALCLGLSVVLAEQEASTVHWRSCGSHLHVEANTGFQNDFNLREFPSIYAE